MPRVQDIRDVKTNHTRLNQSDRPRKYAPRTYYGIVWLDQHTARVYRFHAVSARERWMLEQRRLGAEPVAAVHSDNVVRRAITAAGAGLPWPQLIDDSRRAVAADQQPA